MENDKIIIPMRVSFLLSLLLSEIILLSSGIYVIIMSFFPLPEPINNWFIYNQIIIWSVGIICIIFFGYTLKIIIHKFSIKNYGLIIDDVGIIDNTTGSSGKHIKWENIVKFKRYNFLIIQFIIVIVDNHDEIVKKYKNKLFQIMAKMDYKLVGSTITIYLNMLKCKPKIIYNILQEELKKRKNNE